MTIEIKKKTRKTGVITTTLSRDLVRWLDTTAKRRVVTRRTILEDALRRLRAETLKGDLANSFRRAKNDREMAFLADAGIADWAEQFATHQK